jgi:hypothetical protein
MSRPRFQKVSRWLPPGKTAAICFSIDDIHPSTRHDPYEAGGDLGNGALGHLEWLASRHQKLRTTLFVTADWRCLSPVPTRRRLARVPFLASRMYLAPIRPRGEMRISRHPEFVRYLGALPNTELAFHGLHHVSRGPRIPVEFGRLSRRECSRRLRACALIFAEAATPELIEAMSEAGLEFLSAARDIVSPIEEGGRARMSGLSGPSLIHPEPIASGRLLHFTVNFQATSDFERARKILALGGLLHVKAHVVKEAFGYVAKDALDETYRATLDRLFATLDGEFGESLWWTSMGEIAGKWPREG